jgi:hypothetical protein
MKQYSRRIKCFEIEYIMTKKKNSVIKMSLLSYVCKKGAIPGFTVYS